MKLFVVTIHMLTSIVLIGVGAHSASNISVIEEKHMKNVRVNISLPADGNSKNFSYTYNYGVKKNKTYGTVLPKKKNDQGVHISIKSKGQKYLRNSMNVNPQKKKKQRGSGKRKNKSHQPLNGKQRPVPKWRNEPLVELSHPNPPQHPTQRLQFIPHFRHQQNAFEHPVQHPHYPVHMVAQPSISDPVQNQIQHPHYDVMRSHTLPNPPHNLAQLPHQNRAQTPWLNPFQNQLQPPLSRSLQNHAQPPYPHPLQDHAYPSLSHPLQNYAQPSLSHPLQNYAYPPLSHPLQDHAYPPFSHPLQDHAYPPLSHELQDHDLLSHELEDHAYPPLSNELQDHADPLLSHPLQDHAYPPVSYELQDHAHPLLSHPLENQSQYRSSHLNENQAQPPSADPLEHPVDPSSSDDDENPSPANFISFENFLSRHHPLPNSACPTIKPTQCEIRAEDICKQKFAEPGYFCHSRSRRYSYSRKTGKCHYFFYEGCGGNLNNFFTKTECLKRCSIRNEL